MKRLYTRAHRREHKELRQLERLSALLGRDDRLGVDRGGGSDYAGYLHFKVLRSASAAILKPAAFSSLYLGVRP